MIKEAYVSYETSLLLDEKGFGEETLWYYDSKGVCEPHSAWVDAKPYEYSPMLTHQMACAWLREKGVYMSIDTVISSSGNIYFNIDTYSESTGWNHPVDFYDSYEEAVEAALKYSLENLI